MEFNIFDEGCIIYTIVYFTAFLLALFLSGQKKRLAAFWLLVLLEFLLASLRGIDVGSDTRGYVEMIIPSLSNFSYHDIIFDPSWLVEKEPVCYAFLKFISEPFSTYTPYFFILQAIFWILVGFTMAKYAKDPLLALFVFIAFRFSFFNMTAIRQTLALAVTTFSYRYYDQKKTTKFIIAVIIASLFHRSAIVFLLLLPFRNWNLYNKQWLVVFLMGAFFFVGYIFKSMGGFTELSDSSIAYASYLERSSGGNWFSVLMAIILFVFIIIFINGNHQKEEYKSLYNVIVLGLLFSTAGILSGLFFRIAMYFDFFIPILYSSSLVGVPINKRRLYLVLGMFTMLAIYFMTGIAPGYTPYQFFWEVPNYLR